MGMKEAFWLTPEGLESISIEFMIVFNLWGSCTADLGLSVLGKLTNHLPNDRHWESKYRISARKETWKTRMLNFYLLDVGNLTRV